ncbi:MAG: nuclear transport factor 2 family protein [Myxococcales bacterium]|nr:nuclear transport factor 2 family protein [Myxococcales bacterium]
MRTPSAVLFVCALSITTSGCASGPRWTTHVAMPDERAAIDAVLDDWHAAAAASDLERYMRHISDQGVFLGTDATERWTKDQFRAYATRPFSERRGWSMRSTRRAVMVRGDVAFFDEDLDAVNLGAARGSGVLVRDGGRWQIAQYNLAITVPNERFEEVRTLLSGRANPPANAQ